MILVLPKELYDQLKAELALSETKEQNRPIAVTRNSKIHDDRVTGVCIKPDTDFLPTILITDRYDYYKLHYSIKL